MHRHTGPEPGIIVWGGIGFHFRTPLVRIAGTLNRQLYISEVLEPMVLPYIQRLPSAIFEQDNSQPHMTSNVQEFFTHQIELFLGLLVLRFIAIRKRVVRACTMNGPGYTTRY
ncbi:transposable element Tcb1 transposase [Trichonephila clavipes]|nr:transposable element Tcb1 transposase [Trichonephila clavipes]